MLTAYWVPFRAEAVEVKAWEKETRRQVIQPIYESSLLWYTDVSASIGF